MFQLNHISKQYNGEFALNDVSFQIGSGLNFVIGPSGSGKTTLLKILSGMERNFDGEVQYCGKPIKTLRESERGYFYNHIFGFIWQDFNLLEDCTVWENILLPSYVEQTIDEKSAQKILNQLHIADIRNQKVKLLSGGQKQRIAIARELMKDPQVIIADEPTSALDKESAQTIMEVLRSLSKKKTVIIVTHDTSLIRSGDRVFELDKGELISSEVPQKKAEKKLTLDHPYGLSFQNACSLSAMGIRRKTGRFLIAVLSLLLSGILILAPISGAISDNGQKEFQRLFETYGDALTDIGIYNSFFNASDSKEDAPENQNKGEVNQNIDGLYEKYANDNRVAFVSYLQAFQEISVVSDGKEYKIESSGSIPNINQMIAGHMPTTSQKEVVVPESFVKKMGVSAEDALGKEIHFSGSVVNWIDNKPVYEKTEIQVTICGVMDTTVTLEFEGEPYQISIDDSFLFSKPALDELLKVIGKDTSEMNFLLRAKSPEDMIAIKDELNAQGIVPLGRFELIEDIVRLNQKTGEQSTVANIVMFVLALILNVSTFLLTGFMRKKEYAIYKISGFCTKHFFLLNLTETALQMLTSTILLLATALIWGMVLPVNMQTLSSGVGIVVGLSVFAYIVTAISFLKVDLSKVLKAGDR